MPSVIPNSPYYKDHLSWVKLKQKLDSGIKPPPFFQEREVWWTSVGVNVGHEIDGKNSLFIRPVLILKKFNSWTFLGAPLSTKNKANKYKLPLILKNKVVSVVVSQVRCFSSKRLQDKLSKIEAEIFSLLHIQIKKLL